MPPKKLTKVQLRIIRKDELVKELKKLKLNGYIDESKECQLWIEKGKDNGEYSFNDCINACRELEFLYENTEYEFIVSELSKISDYKDKKKIRYITEYDEDNNPVHREVSELAKIKAVQRYLRTHNQKTLHESLFKYINENDGYVVFDDEMNHDKICRRTLSKVKSHIETIVETVLKRLENNIEKMCDMKQDNKSYDKELEKVIEKIVKKTLIEVINEDDSDSDDSDDSDIDDLVFRSLSNLALINKLI